MSARNSDRGFGAVTRASHWLAALKILTAIPLGLIASRLPYDTAEALARRAELFSIHKTFGVGAFVLGLGRSLWALIARHLVPLHPKRRLKMTLAGDVHWLLYISHAAVPLTGWVHMPPSPALRLTCGRSNRVCPSCLSPRRLQQRRVQRIG